MARKVRTPAVLGRAGPGAKPQPTLSGSERPDLPFLNRRHHAVAFIVQDRGVESVQDQHTLQR